MSTPPVLQVPLPSSDPQLVARVLRAIADELAEQASQIPPAGGPPPDSPTGSSSYLGPEGSGNLRRLLSAITAKARWLVRQVAADNIASGESLGRTIRERAGGVHEGALGGWVGSLSAAERKLDLPSPFETDWEERSNGWQVVYRMERGVAQAVIELLDESGNIVQ